MSEARVPTWLAVCALALVACGQRKPGEKAPDQPATTTGGVNERLLLTAALVALPPPGISPGDLPDPASEGAKDVAEFCTSCHNLLSPAIHSATDWPSVARRMWLRMDRLPPEFGVKVPTMQQRQAILGYLINNALKVSGTTLPEGPGRSTFSQVCSRCHALPDPRNHSPADWPTVVMRMGDRMDQMKVDRATPAEMQQILGYLDKVSAAGSKPPPAPGNE